MKFEDGSQNLKGRIAVVQIVVLLMLTALGVRLYFLQIVRGERYAEMAENQRVRLLPIPAPRGVIFDRNLKPLVDSQAIYNVIMSREEIRNRDLEALVEPLADGLNLDPDYLREQFETIKTQPQFESIRIKEGASAADLAWVEAHTLEHPELRVEVQPQRRYPDHGSLAHVLGYVGEISKKQLDSDEYKQRGLKAGDIIGKEGLEQQYDHLLRGRDGYRKVIVNSRGQIEETIEVVEPQSGQDLVTTLDLDLQRAAEKYLENTPTKRGVIVAMNPTNGEILTLASYPTFDPNLFTQRIGTKEGRREYAQLLNDPKTPLYNRAIRGRYPPGSTWKIPLSVAGLEQNAITVDHSNMACGGGIQIGSKFTRCMGHHGSPPLRTAIKVSCDGYYYRLALKMGIDGVMDMVSDFDFDKPTGIDLPHELTSHTPNYWKPRIEARGREWKDIDTVFSSIGQTTVFITPVTMLRAVAGITTGGKLYVPHLMKEARPVSAQGPFPERPAVSFDRPQPKEINIKPAHARLVMEGMNDVVNGGGTGARIRMADFEIAGKTGTAQVAALGKDTGANKDHAWFVSFAPFAQPEISAVALIENVGFGGTYAAPAVRAVYDVYYEKTRGINPNEQSAHIAQANRTARRSPTN